VGSIAAAACGRADRSHTGGSAAPPAALAPVARSVVRAALSPDSAAAVALADSLSREGWQAEAAGRAAPNGWPVSVVLPGGTELAKLVVHALRQAGLDPQFVGARAGQANIVVGVIPVNHGTHGMAARVRWTASDDRRALLVVEDPRGIENDLVPNAFVFAREGFVPMQRDSVWDVATAPDWRRLAYARAYVTRPGETDTVPPSEWHHLAGSVGLLESVVRKNAFPTSGMVVAYGAARPFLVDVTLPPDSTGGVPEVALPIAEGWRLAWTVDGSRLAVGAPPTVISDDGVPATWRLVDPGTGGARGVADPASLMRPQWVEGPMIDISTAVDMKQRRAFRAGDMDVESEDGWIRVVVRGGARLRSPRVIGPGIPLTATATGEFILALAPDPAAKSYEPPNSLIVYHVLHQ